MHKQKLEKLKTILGDIACIYTWIQIVRPIVNHKSLIEAENTSKWRNSNLQNKYHSVWNLNMAERAVIFFQRQW